MAQKSGSSHPMAQRKVKNDQFSGVFVKFLRDGCARDSCDSGAADGRIASDIAFLEAENIGWEAWGGDFVRVNEDRLDCHQAIRQRNHRYAASAASFGLLFPRLCSFSPCLDNGELSCFFKYCRPFGPAPSPSPFHATIEDWKRC